MLVSTLVDRINYNLRGIDDDAPIEGGDEANYWLSLINAKKDEFASDPLENWTSLFEIRDLATVVAAGVQTYNLPADFSRPSDDVYVTTTDNQRIDFNLLKPQLRDFVSNPVFISGYNPQKLTFVDDIEATSQIVGGTITIGGYFTPDDLTAFSDYVPVDDPQWLAMAVAAEIAFNDVTYEDKYADLVAKANNLYMGMKNANRKGTVTHPRSIPTKVQRISGVS